MKRILLLVVFGLTACATSKGMYDDEDWSTDEPSSELSALADFEPPTTLPETEAWRAQIPEPAGVQMPEQVWQSSRLTNGLRLAVFRAPELPIVMVTLVTKGGSVADPPNQPGLTRLVYGMFESGAAGQDGYRLLQRVRGLDATMFSSVERHVSFVGLQGFSTRTKAMIALLGQIVRQPEFPVTSFEWRVKSMKSGLLAARGNADFMLSQRLREVMYGSRHAYGRSPYGTLQTLSKLRIQDIDKHYNRSVRPESSVLVVVGDVRMSAVKDAAEQAFIGWYAGDPLKPRRAGRLPKPTKRRVHLIHRSGVSQSLVCLGRAFLGPSGEDATALSVAASMLQARLFALLREDKGYTYGVDVSYDRDRDAHSLQICTRLARNQTGDGLRLLLEEMSRFSKGGDLSKAARAAALGAAIHVAYPSRDLESLTWRAADWFVRGQPIQADEHQIRFLLDLDAQRIKAVAQQYLRPEDYQVVMVADAKRVRADVEALKLGRLSVTMP